MKRCRLSILFTVLLVIAACKPNREHEIDFYYWKTNVLLGEMEQDYFYNLGSQRLYIRFFAVDNDGTCIRPLAQVKSFNHKELQAEYVPVIFMTNRTFNGINHQGTSDLAQHIFDLTNEIVVANKLPEINEIQIDCDWTSGTRNDYFRFLECLKKVSNKKITCTLRLHQVAERRKNGIPPVEKGYLMCYATSSPTDFSEKNSILDISLLKSYLKTINDYPVAFDVALPIYSWAVVKNHLRQIKLINNVTEVELRAENRLQPLPDKSYEAVDNFFFRGIFLNKGFRIKVEEISPKLLQEAKTFLNKHLHCDYRIVYYHLDQPFLEQYRIEQLK
jgi:hypothetical protein